MRAVAKPLPPAVCAHLCGDHLDPRQARVWICDNCGATRGVAVIENNQTPEPTEPFAYAWAEEDGDGEGATWEAGWAVSVLSMVIDNNLSESEAVALANTFNERHAAFHHEQKVDGTAS